MCIRDSVLGVNDGIFFGGSLTKREFLWELIVKGHFREHRPCGKRRGRGISCLLYTSMSYIDYIVRQNPEDFAQAGFIGKGVHSRHAKW